MGFPALQDWVPRPAHKLTLAEGLGHRPRPAKWEMSLRHQGQGHQKIFPRGSVRFPSIHGNVRLLK